MLTSRQTTHSRDDDRERITRARHAAEELFRPKQQVTQETVPDALSSVEQSPRKPRVLAVSPAMPIRRDVVETPVNLKQQTMPVIPASKFAGIRTWVKYGMTAPQVAQVYGVAVEEIERILRRA